MPTIDEHKLDILQQLLKLESPGSEPKLQLQASLTAGMIRAIADLVARRIITFADGPGPSCQLTDFGKRTAGELIRELEMKHTRK